MTRQRAPMSRGVLATAGGVVFAGALDRGFAAYDDATGREFWQTRLNDVPNRRQSATWSTEGSTSRW